MKTSQEHFGQAYALFHLGRRHQRVHIIKVATFSPLGLISTGRKDVIGVIPLVGIEKFFCIVISLDQGDSQLTWKWFSKLVGVCLLVYEHFQYFIITLLHKI